VINPTLEKAFEDRKKDIESRTQYSDANRVFAWHGTSEENIQKIIRTGFKLSKLGSGTGNNGWYGAGIYLSENATLGRSYAKDNKLLLCEVILGRPYQMNLLPFVVGCALQNGYDSHVVGTANKLGEELVIFNEAQILPRYIVHYSG